MTLLAARAPCQFRLALRYCQRTIRRNYLRTMHWTPVWVAFVLTVEGLTVMSFPEFAPKVAERVVELLAFVTVQDGVRVEVSEPSLDNCVYTVAEHFDLGFVLENATYLPLHEVWASYPVPWVQVAHRGTNSYGVPFEEVQMASASEAVAVAWNCLGIPQVSLTVGY